MPWFKGNPKERRTQLYFRDDGTFEFRKLDIEDSFLVDKDTKGSIIRAWIMYFKLLKRFPGFKNIGADMVTISYSRNTIYDLFGQLTKEETPTLEGKLKDGFVKRVAESKCYQHEQKAASGLIMDKLTMFLGTLMILLGLSLGIVAVY